MFTWKQLAEWVCRSPRSTVQLIEQVKRRAEQMGDAGALDAAPATDADPDQTVTDGLKQAAHAAVDALFDGSMSIQDVIAKLKCGWLYSTT